MTKTWYVCVLAFLSILTACGESNVTLPEGYQEGDQNFSVSQFMEDQWQFYEGQPFLLRKKITINDQTDTGYQDLDSAFFFKIKDLLDKSDISELKYLSQYKYEVIEEKPYFSLVYTALDEDLFTQLLVVNLSYENNKILHVYVETKKENLFHTKTQKITFAPLKFIQVIEYEKSFLSSPKYIQMDYVF